MDRGRCPAVVGFAPAGTGANGTLMRTGNRNLTGMAMAVSGLMMAHQVAGKASRDAIFLSQFRAADLPAIVTVAAIVSVGVSILVSRALVRIGPNRMTPLAFALSSVLQVSEWVLLRYHPRIAACVIYVHLVALGAALLSSFWSVMNESFEPRTAKQLFGRISGAGTLGGLCGGLLAERVAAWFGAADVMLLLAMLQLACAALLWRAFPTKTPLVHEPPASEAIGSKKTHAAGTTVVDAVQRYPFLLTLAGLVIAASSATALLDFVFKAQAAHTIGRGAPLLRFFGLYYTATSLLTFLMQTFVARRTLQHAGLAASAGALPASVTLGSLAALVIPGFPALSVVRGIEILMRGSLYRSAYELFYTAIAPADKRAVKSLIDVGADRAGDAIGSAGVTLMLVLAPGRYGPILGLASGIAVIAGAFAARLRGGCVRALEQTLLERAVELDLSLLGDLDARSIFMKSVAIPVQAKQVESPAHASANPAADNHDAVLRKAADLRSGDALRVIHTASELGPGDWALAPFVIELLAWDETMPAARDALRRMGARITGLLVDALLDRDGDFVVRRRVPRVLAYLPSRRSADGLFAALDDPRFEVRFYAARALYLLVQEKPGLTVEPERVWAVINRELSLQRSVWDSYRLLDARGSQEKDWFFDAELKDRADRNLEHLFTLLALLLPADAIQIAFRALHTEDRQLKGTAFEYLESATPPGTRKLLLPLLEADAETRTRSAGSSGALRKLLASHARVNATLKLQPLAMEARL